MADTPYLTADEIKEAVPALAALDDTVLTDLVGEFEEIAEDYCGVAFTPRSSVTETHTLYRDRWLYTRWPIITSVTSIAVTLAGTTTTLDSTTWRYEGERGAVDLASCYTGEAVIVYGHGLAIAVQPKSLLRACRLYVRSAALRDESNVGRDVLTQAFEGGGTTRYSTPNKAEGRPTGYLDVDRLLNTLPSYRIPGIA